MPDERELPTVGIALGAGVSGGIQPKINAVLGERLGNSLIASLVNFSVAGLGVVAALSIRPQTRRVLRRLRTWPVPWWTRTAGLGGAIIVLAGVVTIETIGVAVYSIANFAGQIVSGLLIDRFGIGGGSKRQVSAARVQGVVLATAAVALTQIGREAGTFAPGHVAFAVAAGVAVAFQSAFNGRITSATGDAVAATALNVAVGAVALAAVVAVLATTGHVDHLRWPSEPWLYLGGALGVTVVFSMALTTARVGVLLATLAMLAGQMTTALVVDWVVDEEPPNLAVVSGAVLIVAAVALSTRRQSPGGRGFRLRAG